VAENTAAEDLAICCYNWHSTCDNNRFLV